MANGDGSSFTVKEILLDLRDDVKDLSLKIDRIDQQGSIGTKSELSDHEDRIRNNDGRLSLLEKAIHATPEDIRTIKSDLATLQLWRASLTAVATLKRWQITVTIGCITAASGLIGGVITFFVFK